MLRLRKTPRFDALLDGAIEIDEHHHPELRREAGKRDEAHRRGNGDGVAEDIDEPYAADERERQCQQDDQRLPHAPESEIGRAHVELQSLMRISYAVFCLKKKNSDN